MAISDITTTVTPLAPANTNVPVSHTLAGTSMTATKEIYLERFLIERRKTKTKVITLANHKGHR